MMRSDEEDNRRVEEAEDCLEIFTDEMTTNFEDDKEDTTPDTNRTTYYNKENLLQLIREGYSFSGLKTLFWRICCLMIIQVDGLLTEEEFLEQVKANLYLFTNSSNAVDQLARKSLATLREVKNIATLVYNTNFGVNVESDIIRSASQDAKDLSHSIVYVELLCLPRSSIKKLVQCVDFGLSSRIQLALYAGFFDVGFNEFNSAVRSEVNSLKDENLDNLLPVYKRCKEHVLNSTVYITNRTYGVICNKFYQQVRLFINKI